MSLQIGGLGMESSSDARYIYCIVDRAENVNLGKIGIEGSEVYTILYKDLCIVVHNCEPEPYKSEDDKQIKVWIITHEKVVETVWDKFGTVIPLGFDTIVKGDESHSADENLNNWLNEDYENLKKKLNKIKDKAEYGIQVSWDPKIIGEQIAEKNEELKNLKEKITSLSKGVAYMYRQKLEDMLKKELEKEADRCFKDFYDQIKRCVDEIKVEKTKKLEKDKQMLINLSCLLPKEKSKILGEELEKINNMKGFFVRFTGPWPPYSFV